MAKYIKQEMPDIQGKGEKKCYYRLAKNRNLSAKEFLKRCSVHGMLDEGILEHALSDMVDQLVEDLADGYSVTIGGIGTFKATLGVREDKEMDTLDGDDTKRNARSVEVKNVRYVSDKQMVKQVNMRCELSRAGVSRVNSSPYTKEQRLQLALDYLSDSAHPFMRVSDYAELTGTARSTAARELRAFAEDASCDITTSGRATAKVYVKQMS